VTSLRAILNEIVVLPVRQAWRAAQVRPYRPCCLIFETGNAGLARSLLKEVFPIEKLAEKKTT